MRLLALLDARELVVGLIRGRLRRRYPKLSRREINLKLLRKFSVPSERPPDLSLFLDTLCVCALEVIDAPSPPSSTGARALPL